MPITHASFGLVTRLLDLALGEIEGTPSATSPDAWEEILAPVAALGVGAIAEEVALGEDDTISRFLDLRAAAARHGIELFLRLRELADEGLWTLREKAMEAAARLAPGESDPSTLRLLADLGQPSEEELDRWLPRRGREAAVLPDEGPGGWGQPLAFSLFAVDVETAVRRLDQVAELLLEVGGRPGVELPVWLAGFGIGEEGAAGSAAGVVQIGVHALSLGIERVFLAPGPADGWWPADLRSPPPPLQAFRTLAAQLEGALRVTWLAAGQYRIEGANQRDCYVLWGGEGSGGLPIDLRGTVLVTTVRGESRQVEVGRVRLTDEPVFVVPIG